jgi:hypothetical protein
VAQKKSTAEVRGADLEPGETFWIPGEPTKTETDTVVPIPLPRVDPDAPQQEPQDGFMKMGQPAGHWRDRFVARGWVRVDELLANPNNWRIHPREQQELIAASLERLGWIQDIRVNVNTQHMFDGHQRVLEADKAGQEFVPVSYYDLSPDEEKEAIATIDAITTMAVADTGKLDELAREILRQREEEDVEADGSPNTAAMTAFLESLVQPEHSSGRARAPGDRTLLQGEPEGATLYSPHNVRQIVLHYGPEDYAEVTRMLKWARGFYGVDTTPEAVLHLLKEGWVAAGRPELDRG